jgi:aldose 1-epimerase
MTCILACASVARGEAPRPEPFGTTKDGQAVEIFTLSNQTGMTVRLMTRGATIVNLLVPDRSGNVADVVLGFDDVAGYESGRNQYFGCTAGRVANRIAKGQFILERKSYQLAVNNGPNHLHGGGERSFDKVLWKGTGFETPKARGVDFQYTSPAGEEGYPGKLDCHVRFSLSKDRNELTIDYSASTDAPTPINLTNHTYYNLAGAGTPTVLDHELQLFADRYTPTDDTLIPTGTLEAVEGTPLDFRQPHPIGERIASFDEWAGIGYDHNFAVNGANSELRPVARLRDPVSGRTLEIDSTQPGVQLYSGNHLNGAIGKQGKAYPKRSAVCLETQHFPDSINHSEFPDTVLRPGNRFHEVCVWRFSAK